MKHRCVLAIVVLALLLSACTAAPAGLAPEDRAAIRAVTAAMDRTALELDWGAFASLLTEDAVFMPPNEPPVEGRAACKAWLESAGYTEITKHDAELVTVGGRGDFAYSRAITSESFSIEGVEEPMEDVIKWLAIWRKQTDGSWLIAIISFNSDLPLPE